MRRYKLHKPERSKLATLFKAYMEALGAIHTPTGHVGALEYTLNTALGLLSLTYFSNDDGYFPTLFTRFDNPALAKDTVDCNPHSGKYNCHLTVTKDMTAIDVLDEWNSHLRPILWHRKNTECLGLRSSNFILSLTPIDKLNHVVA